MTATPFDNYEISPCTRTEEPERPGHFYFEVCEPNEADVWTLYGHLPEGGVQAIGDFSTRESAEEAYHCITGQPFASHEENEARVRLMQAASKMFSALRIAQERFGTLIDADEDTAADCKAYDEICAAIEVATGRTA